MKHQAISPRLRFRSSLLKCCVAATWLFLSVYGLAAQDINEREDLSDALNIAKQSLVFPTDNTSVPLDDPAFGTVSLKNHIGGCVGVSQGDVLELVTIDDEDDNKFILRRLLKPETDADIPGESHTMPCRLNDWLHHSWTGQQGQRDDDGIEQGFDDHCTDGANCPSNCELYYTKAPNASNPAQPDMLGQFWFPSAHPGIGLYDTRLMEQLLSVEESVAIEVTPSGTVSPGVPAYLFTGSSLPIVHGYRKPSVNGTDPDTNITKRSHFSLVFDYTKVPTDYDYMYKVGASYYIRSLELWFQLQSYGPSPACSVANIPSANPDLTPYSGSTLITMKVGYSTTPTGTVQYVTCTQETPSGSNSDANEANEWLWNERKSWGSQYGFAGLGEFHLDTDGFLFFEFKENSLWQNTWGTAADLGGLQFYSIKLRNRTSPAEYCEAVYPIDGQFCIDEMTGELVYYHGVSATCPCSSCYRQRVVCIDFCDPQFGDRKVDNVIAASARTFEDTWEYDPDAIGAWSGGFTNKFLQSADNRFQRGEDAMWRMQRGFVYRTSIKSGIGGNKVHDDAGVFVDNLGSPIRAFTLYNWREPAENDDAKWLNASTITQYAPSGEPVEEHNILDIYSAVRLAHGNIVPKLVAANAEYETVDFESFEDPTLWKDNVSVVNSYAHSGSSSYSLDANGGWSSIVLAADINQHIVDSGLIVKFWVKRTYADLNDPEDNSTPYTPVQVKIGGHLYATPSTGQYGTLEENVIHKVAQTGEWVLYQLLARDFDVVELQDEEDTPNDLPVRVKQNLDNTYDVWIDDMRIQPYDAQMNCYVYDKDNLRSIAMFDDQHFGAYYQYNGEGKLVRTLRETERGKKTIAETQYHSYDLQRSSFTPGGPIASISSRYPDSDDVSASGSVESDAGYAANLVGLQVNRDGASIDFFDGAEVDAPQVTSSDFQGIKTNILQALDLPEAEAMVYIRELEQLEQNIDSLTSLNDSTLSEESIRQRDERMDELKQQRKAIVTEKLGISEEDWANWYQDMKDSDADNSKEN